MNLNHQGIGMTSMRTRERLIERLMKEGISNRAVLDAVRNMPRHIFVDEALASRAYEDTALPIGHGQTISQPYIVARMTEVLVSDGPLNKVLEIGTGCGYQTAILARLVKQVYSVERIKALLNQSRNRFLELNLNNISVRYNDGSWGWPEHAPYDGIIVTAAPLEVPTELIEQLEIGGRMVIPVGERSTQHLLLIRRTSNGYEEEVLEKVRFVSLLGGKI